MAMFLGGNVDMGLKSIQLLIILLSFVQASKVQIISQKLNLSDITIGDRITYTLMVEHDKNTQLLQPEPIAIASEHFEVYGPEVKELKDKATQRGGVLKLIEYELTVYEPGAYNIPPIIITCLDVNGREFSVISKPLAFKVRSIKPNGAQTIKDIKGPEGVPRNLERYILIVGIVIVGFSIIAYLYFKRQKPSPKIEPETIILQRLPHELALEELREIDFMGLVDKDKIKEYYTRISEVIRRYIGKRYGIAALELTTAKVLDALELGLSSHGLAYRNPYQRSNHLRGDLIGKISAFLHTCDAVKFAKYQPGTDEAYNLLQQARKIIELTITSASNKDTEAKGVNHESKQDTQT
jgi:hypothetical protein